MAQIKDSNKQDALVAPNTKSFSEMSPSLTPSNVDIPSDVPRPLTNKSRSPSQSSDESSDDRLNHISIPHQYPNANANRNVDFENLNINIKTTNNWRVYKRLGQGKYSEVFEGKNTDTNEIACVKILKPVIPKLLKLEIYVLQELSNGPNIVKLLYTLRDQRTDLWCLVFELLECKELKEITKMINDYEMRYYLYHILKGLDYAHSQGIIHRDIKPANVLIDIKNKKVRVIDWGLACFYYPKHEYNVRVATRSYKAPELLCGYKQYHYGIDLWAFGCMMAGIMFNRQYFFHGRNLQDQLIKIIEVMGSDKLEKFCDKYDISVPKFIIDEINNERYDNTNHKIPEKTWESFKSDNNAKNKFISNEAIDLLDKLLQMDPNDRITAKDAMEHPYFDVIRDKVNSTEVPKFDDEDEEKVSG